ncbi:MAG: hypothetical protein WC768_02100 [Patescibacteria group bacterium]
MVAVITPGRCRHFQFAIAHQVWFGFSKEESNGEKLGIIHKQTALGRQSSHRLDVHIGYIEILYADRFSLRLKCFPNFSGFDNGFHLIVIEKTFTNLTGSLTIHAKELIAGCQTRPFQIVDAQSLGGMPG